MRLDWREYSVDLDEFTHYEPPHQDLRCLQIQLYASLVLKELILPTSSSACLFFLFLFTMFCRIVFLRLDDIEMRRPSHLSLLFFLTMSVYVVLSIGCLDISTHSH